MSNIDSESLHIPVLSEEVCNWLTPEHPTTILDCTVGYGGHAERLLMSCPPGSKVIGLDRDPKAIDFCRQRLTRFGDHVMLRQGDYRDLKHHLKEEGVVSVGGVLFDLGASSPQLNDVGRGFSFLHDGPLDMRMDQSVGQTAADLVNASSEHELADILFHFGEERYARRIARAIVQERNRRPLETTGALVSIIARSVPASYRHGRIHCATRTFQALRIAVNQELECLESSLRDATEVLLESGRLCAISFHSLEDRIVKHTFRSLAQEAESRFSVLTKKPIVPSWDECEANPRARSAKLRVIERRPTKMELI